MDRVHCKALFLTGNVESASCAVYLLICGRNNGVCSNAAGKVMQEGNHFLIQANSVRLKGLRQAL